jgi:hypothetical protein
VQVSIAGTNRGNERGSSQRGGSKLNALFTIVILGAMAFVAVKIIPVYVAGYEFQDAIETESRFALTGYPKKSVDDVRQDVFKKAQDLGLPITADTIRVDMTTGTVAIAVDYTVPIDLKVYQFNWDFHPHADNHTI